MFSGKKVINLKSVTKPLKKKKKQYLKCGNEIHLEVTHESIKTFQGQRENNMNPNTRDPRKSTPKHVLIKMAKIKDKDSQLKAARESGCPTASSRDLSAPLYPYV